MTAQEIIKKYINFFEKRGHKRIVNSPLVPQDDPTTLFTSSGMQPLIPYLLGEPHPQGKRLVNVQNSFRAVDIDEVGDNRHTTFFRMLGNWSLGDYFKKEEIPWLWEFLTKELKLPEEKLYITVFAGEEGIDKDSESFEIWKTLVPEDKIFWAGVDKNWWSRSGVPKNMPVGEIGGPDTEVYYRFEDMEHDKACKDNPVECDCGKFLEIANSVFIQYQKNESDFKELPQKNVDFGGGLERLLAAAEERFDIFETSLFAPIIDSIEKNILVNHKYGDDHRIDKAFRIMANHLVSAVFLIDAGVLPGNKDRESVVRRLIRKAVAQKFLWGEKQKNFEPVVIKIIDIYSETDSLDNSVIGIITEEESKANKAIAEAFRVWANWVQENPSSGTWGSVAWGNVSWGSGGKLPPLSAEKMFNLYQSHGLSLDIIEEVTHGNVDKEGFDILLKRHQEKSKTASAGMFKGGLADHSELTVKGHTATHLLHQALRDVFGNELHQTGSNITSERVRFDFNLDRLLTPDEVKKVEDIVNSKILDNLPVHFEMLPIKEAKEIGAIGLFDEKYEGNVKVYFIGDYSKEFCGGPHVDWTGRLNSFTILKQENLGRGQKRIYAKVE